MKYYIAGFMLVLMSTGIASLWGFVDTRWFFAVASLGLVIHFTLDMFEIK